MFEAAAECERLHLPFAIVTITGIRGTAPRKSGRMIVTADGHTYGTVGGGCVERKAEAEALEAIRKGCGRNITADTGKGEVYMMVDVPLKGRKLHVIGSGHVGLEIARLMYASGYAVYLYDINPEVSFENAAGISVGVSWKEALSTMKTDSRSAVIVTVQDKSEILPFLESSEAFYIGYLSSRSKSRVDRRRNIYVPMGLDIGAETPEEIAISVAAEILKAASGASGRSLSRNNARTILVRGAGDLATGVIIKLRKAGYNVIAAEIGTPTVIRSTVSFAEAMFSGSTTVEGVEAVRITDPSERFRLFDEGKVPLIEDPELKMLAEISPMIVVDAILAKKNLGTSRELAPYVIALGPGFTAGVDCDVVIETNRGHELGRIIESGTAAANTGVPGMIAGYGAERVVRAPSEGVWKAVHRIGDVVEQGETIAYAGDTAVPATISGMIRGMLHDGIPVTPGFKCADIDPRGAGVDYTHVSDKARCIAGAVLEACDDFVSRI